MAKSDFRKIWILMPVFEDWQSAEATIREISTLLQQENIRSVIVDDGSSKSEKSLNVKSLLANPKENPIPTSLLTLPVNMGNSFALSVGVEFVAEKKNERDLLVVMDADGEDQPSHIRILIEKLEAEDLDVVVAKRGRRYQSMYFYLMHSLFKYIFRVLTSKSIDFGNFMVLNDKAVISVRHKIRLGEKSLPGTILSLNLRMAKLKLDRGKRHFEKSKTGSVGLILWGMGILSSFANIALAKLIKLSLIFSGFVFFLTGTVFVLRFTTNLFIPGTISTLLALAIVFILQLVQLSAISVLLLGRVQASHLSLPLDQTFYVIESYERSTNQSKRKGLIR